MVQKQVTDILKYQHSILLAKAKLMEISNDFEIHLNSSLADSLGFNDNLVLNGFNVPVIRDKDIQLEENKSDIYIFDPKHNLDN